MDEILFNLISSWPGLIAKPDRALLEDSLVLLDFLPPGPLRLIDVEHALDAGELGRLERLGLAERREGTVALTARGRFLGDGVTAALLA